MLVRTLLASLLAVAAVGAQQPALRVLRATPTGDAAPTTEITVAFDRPVAGSLDRTVDARTLFQITPPVNGHVEWRDPITVRFVPAQPLTPTATYTVTIANRFQAMDGSRLAQPYRFTFRVRGPEVLTGSPVGMYRRPEHLRERTKFELVTSSPVNLERFAAAVRLEFGDSCATRTTIPMRALAQRLVVQNDPYDFRGAWSPRRQIDSTRRVVSLVPERALPADCRGELVAPRILEAEDTAAYHRWTFRTAGPFTIRHVRCAWDGACPKGPVALLFSTPVRGSEVLKQLRLEPAAPFTVRDTIAEDDRWELETSLVPRSDYTLVVNEAMVDAFGQRFQGESRLKFSTTGFAKTVSYQSGRVVVERNAFRTLAVTHVNLDTLEVETMVVPESLVLAFTGAYPWRLGQMWPVTDSAALRRLPVRSVVDRPMVTGVRVPAFDARRPGAPLLTALRIGSKQTGAHYRPVVLAQVTNLGVHARGGAMEAEVWVTALDNGRAVRGATVVLRDSRGRERGRARTDTLGIARLVDLRSYVDSAMTDDERYESQAGLVDVTLADDRAVVPINQYEPDLSPWQFRVSQAWGSARLPVAGAVFTERGIYRPGEAVYAKAIVRTGPLGALRAPSAGDSLRWVFHDREEGTLRDTVVALSRFGTATQQLPVPAGSALGTYAVGLQLRRAGDWVEIARTSYRVAEYRPPEFLVNVMAPTDPRFAGDSVSASIDARYLFGAPMSRAAISWTAQQAAMSPWELSSPGTDGYFVGETGVWWEDEPLDQAVRPSVIATGEDTLDAAGALTVRLALPAPPKGRPARATIRATVTDVNRQTVSDAATLVVHPASFYIAAKPEGTSYFWTAGTPRRIALLTVAPDGRRIPGIAIQGTIVRREWHRVQRERDGASELRGEWVSDTVARCSATSGTEPASCDFTPATGGIYVVTFRARDDADRAVATSFVRWAAGAGFVPWYDENRLKMDVIADKSRYAVGDTATILFAVPFTNAEAWITVEREGVIERRRLRITAGATTLKLPITEAYAPNAYVSMLVARGRSEPPGRPDDPGRPTIRVGYTELRVTPEVKRLAVHVEPLIAEYQPGDTARVRVRVRDAKNAGQRSEVTLWAVDEGVLALTGYQTPDPIDLIYRARGLGLRLSSNLVSVAAQVVQLQGVTIKGDSSPGGGGGRDASGVLRSQFRPTAFFLGAVVTDANGGAVAAAKLPDNLTTFRIMAVAVTDGDRYGNGKSSLLVTRPLLARPALPQFLRRDDAFSAGVVVNQRAGGTPNVRVTATATGVQLRDSAAKSARLEAGRGREVRFAFRDTTTDTAVLGFHVTDGTNQDAVETRLPVKPAFHPRAYTIAGVLVDTTSLGFALPADIDPARSRLELSLGTSPLAIVRGAYRWLRVYPYDCTEQITSEVLPLIALARAQQSGADLRLPSDWRQQIETAIATLSRRQRADGGIGLWHAADWTTPWLTAYAGSALVDAKAAGFAVNDSVLARLGEYVRTKLHAPESIMAPVVHWYNSLQYRLADQVAAVDLLSRLGRPDVSGENSLLRLAAQLAWEDRARLALVLSRRNAREAARRLLQPAWASVTVEGRRAVLPQDAVRPFYFYSNNRAAATLLLATLAVDSSHQLIGPLVETLVQQGRAGALSPWNTQDFGAVLVALAAFDRRQRSVARPMRLTGASGLVLATTAGTGRDSTLPLTGLLGAAQGGKRTLNLRLEAPQAGAPVYYYLTVVEVPLQRPTTPDNEGIALERWYEDYTTGKPITSINEGSLVRVRLRVTVPADRQFVVIDDALPAGLEAVDLSLRTVGGLPGPGTGLAEPWEVDNEQSQIERPQFSWYYGYWDAGWWSPFDHREMRDDRVVYVATLLWRGTYSATYVARATTPGTFVLPPAHSEEMYNPAVHGRSAGGTFTVIPKAP